MDLSFGKSCSKLVIMKCIILNSLLISIKTQVLLLHNINISKYKNKITNAQLDG